MGRIAAPQGSQKLFEALNRSIYQEGLSFSGYERDKLFVNRGKGPFLDVSAVSGIDSPTDGRAVLVADFDNDAAPDVFLSNLQETRHELYRGEWGRRNNWLRLILEGRASNRDAVGATIRAHLPPEAHPGGRVPQVLLRTIQCGNAFLTSSDKRVLLGLGKAGAVSDLEVRWPSGRVQSFGAVQGNQTLRLVEGEREPRIVEIRSFRLGGDGPIDESWPGRDAGIRLPELALTALDGSEIRSADLQGRWHLVNVWSPTCLPCLTEMPELQRLHERLAGRLRVLGLALVPEGERPSVEATVKSLGITYDVALAPESLVHRLFGRGAEIPVPTSYLVDPAGVVVAVYEGASELWRLLKDATRVATDP